MLRVLLRGTERMCFSGHEEFHEREAEKDSESAVWPILHCVHVSTWLNSDARLWFQLT